LVLWCSNGYCQDASLILGTENIDLLSPLIALGRRDWKNKHIRPIRRLLVRKAMFGNASRWYITILPWVVPDII
jgi:hypothetical protein